MVAGRNGYLNIEDQKIYIIGCKNTFENFTIGDRCDDFNVAGVLQAVNISIENSLMVVQQNQPDFILGILHPVVRISRNGLICKVLSIKIPYKCLCVSDKCLFTFLAFLGIYVSRNFL